MEKGIVFRVSIPCWVNKTKQILNVRFFGHCFLYNDCESKKIAFYGYVFLLYFSYEVVVKFKKHKILEE